MLLALAAAVLAATLLPAGFCRGATVESFETAEPTWKLVESDCGARLTAQRRVFDMAHSGNGSEMVRVFAGRGSYAYLAHDAGRARVIAELTPSLWVKSDHAGLQLLARVVLPRTADARGAPMTTLIGGSSYRDVGHWQRLSIENAALALQRQERVLRLQHGPHVDVREAYVDLLLINGYGGPGMTTIWLDDLEMAAAVQSPPAQGPPQATRQGVSQQTPQTASQAVAGRTRNVSRSSADRLFPGPQIGQQPDEAPQLHGSVLVAGGRPLLVRAIEHNGEPLEWLAGLGFNAVVFDHPASDEQLSEAARAGIWLVAPPPQVIGGSRITALHERVLAWNLGEGLDTDDAERTRQLAADVRRADPVSGRPLVCNVRGGMWRLSRLTDVLLVRREPIGTSFELSDFAAWLDERSRLARPGTPVWAAVQTQHGADLLEQWRALGLPQGEDPPVDPQQVHLLACAAVSAGAKGIIFTSRSRLDAATPSAQLRAANLRRLNYWLAAVEPWASGGEVGGDAETGTPSATASVLQTQRSRLLLLMRQAPGQQYVVAPPERAAVSIVSGSALSSAQVYRITSASLEPLPHQRVAGGTRITLDDVGLSSSLLLTQEPLVIHHLMRRIAEDSHEVAQLDYEIASRWLESVERVHAQLAARGKGVANAEALLGEAKANLRRCGDVLATRDYRSGQLYADRAMATLSRLRRSSWQQTAEVFSSPVASPCCATFETLPLHWALADRLGRAQWTANLLPGGDMEQLDFMRRAGWRRDTRKQAEQEIAVELSPQAMHGGASGLRLQVLSPESADPAAQAVVVEAPPLWITSAPVRVRGGQVLRIHGWVYLPAAIEGSRDGLLVYDSLGGPALAERITQAGAWREFTLYRAAPRDGDVTVRFSLTGRGEAWIDDVTIQAAAP